jgi:HPr kinase/phosphorylase
VPHTLNDLFSDNQQALDLRWVVGDSQQRWPLPDAGQHGIQAAELVGHLNLIHPHRLHVLGASEVEYLERMSPVRRSVFANELIEGDPIGLVLAEDRSLPPEILHLIEAGGGVMFASSRNSAEVIDVLRIYLAKVMAPHCSMHGVFMDVLGMGVLISGASGLGKSELALELISRGHGLVADDVVDFARIAPDAVEGRCPQLLSNLLEVRGLGLLDIRSIFGETAVRRKMRLRLIVELVRRSAVDSMERLPLADTTQPVLGLPFPKVTIPVAAGRNLAVLLEAAVRNTILKLRGIDTMAEFMERQRRAMNGEDLS